MRRVGVLMHLPESDPEDAGARAGVAGGAAAIRMDRRPQHPDRLPLRSSGCRPQSQIRGGIDRPRAGRHPGASGTGPVAALEQAIVARCRSYLYNSLIRSTRASSTACRARADATGFTVWEDFGTSGKWLELLKQVAPHVTRVAVLRKSTCPLELGKTGAIQSVAPTLGVQVSPVGVRNGGEIERSISAFAREANGGLIGLVPRRPLCNAN